MQGIENSDDMTRLLFNSATHFSIWIVRDTLQTHLILTTPIGGEWFLLLPFYIRAEKCSEGLSYLLMVTELVHQSWSQVCLGPEFMLLDTTLPHLWLPM